MLVCQTDLYTYKPREVVGDISNLTFTYKVGYGDQLKLQENDGTRELQIYFTGKLYLIYKFCRLDYFLGDLP